jgi:hypothetical protein
VTAAERVDLRSRLVLLQQGDDLLVSETAALHGTSSFVHSKVKNTSPQWPGSRGEGQVTLFPDARTAPAGERIDVAGVGRSRRYRAALPRGRADEDAITADIVELAFQYGRYGYRRITALLRDAGWAVNVKRVERRALSRNRSER